MFGKSGFDKDFGQKSLVNTYVAKSAKRLLIVTTNLNGFSLVNR